VSYRHHVGTIQQFANTSFLKESLSMALQTVPLSQEVTIVLGATGSPPNSLTVFASADHSHPTIANIAIMPGRGFLLTGAWYTAIDGLENMPNMTLLDAQVAANTDQALVKVMASAIPGASGSIRIRITALNQTTV
jgi:hypothetical protein